MKNISGKQQILAFVFAIVVISGFFATYLTATYYDGQSESSVLFETDTNTNFGFLEFEKVAPVTDYYDYYRNGVYQVIGGEYNVYNKTAVYSGNETWSISSNATSINSATIMIVEIPNLDEWIIESVNISCTKSLDTDITFIIDIYSLEDLTIKSSGETGGTNIFTDSGIGNNPNSKFWQNITVAQSTALNVYDKSQDNNNHYIVVQFVDKDKDGMEEFTMSLNLEIHGKATTEFNLQGALMIGLGFAIFLKTIVFIFMFDSIDIGGYVNDKRKSKRNYGKTRSLILPFSILGFFMLVGTVSAQSTETSYVNQIDMLYVIPLMVLILTGIAMYTGKLSFTWGILAIGLSIIIVYFASPYTTMMLVPLKNSIWFGYSWGYFEYMVLIDIILLFLMSIVGFYNLYITRGLKFWL